MQKNTDYDVVIIGGGPAGCAAAIRLSQLTKLRVLLVDRGDSREHRIGESIPPDTRNLLKVLKLWSRFKAQHHDPCLGSCSAWGNESLGYNDFIYNPMGHGWHLDRKKFNHMLQLAVEECGTAFRKSKFIHTQSTDLGYRLTLSTAQKKQQITTQWVIDASGIKASFSGKLGNSIHHHDNQVCLTGFFAQHDAPALNQLTLLEATTYGWWYAARLPSNKTVVALACDRRFMQRFELRKECNWLKLLMAHSFYIAPQVASQCWLDGSLTINSTPSCISKEITGKQWLVTGDAAAAYDPISAQGIYKALSQGIQAAEAIGLQQQGNSMALKQYSQSIKQQYAIYLEQRNHLYQQEKRWQNAPFWQKRQAPIGLKTA